MAFWTVQCAFIWYKCSALVLGRTSKGKVLNSSFLKLRLCFMLNNRSEMRLLSVEWRMRLHSAFFFIHYLISVWFCLYTPEWDISIIALICHCQKLYCTFQSPHVECSSTVNYHLELLAKAWVAGWKGEEQSQSNQRLSSKSSRLCHVPPKFHVKPLSWTSMFPVPYDRKGCGNDYSSWVIKEINPER